jgi:hypothetical protein
MITHTKEEVLNRIDEYVKQVQVMVNEQYKDYSLPVPVVSAEIGKVYAKIIKREQNRGSVHTFIRLDNGDILKAASWKAPAKNGVRGNIFHDISNAVNAYGAVYLR